MPTQLVPGEDDGAAIMATIGHICIQWARLESTLLGICAVLARTPPSEAFIIFGGLDMRPRLNMAVNLARHHKMERKLLDRLTTIRVTITKEKLDDKRNQAVHGAHSDSTTPQHVKLTMARWSGDKRDQEISIAELHKTGLRLNDLANEAYLILIAYVESLGVNHSRENANDTFVKTNPTA
jgi:hypothetical protein